MTVSAFDLLLSRWSGLLVALGLLLGLVAFHRRERTRKAVREQAMIRWAMAGAYVCALLAVVGRVIPLVK